MTALGGSNTVTLSSPIHAALASTALTFNSPELTLTSFGNVKVGQLVTVAGVPAQTTVAAVSSLIAAGTADRGSTTLTLGAANTGVIAGQSVSGVGVAPGTTVSAIDGANTVVTLSTATEGAIGAFTESGTGLAPITQTGSAFYGWSAVEITSAITGERSVRALSDRALLLLIHFTYR